MWYYRVLISSTTLAKGFVENWSHKRKNSSEIAAPKSPDSIKQLNLMVYNEKKRWTSFDN